MRMLFFAILTGILLFEGCKSSHDPNDAALKKAINQYLQVHGKACTWIGQTFPVDVSDSQQKLNFGIAGKMAALEQAGLVRSVTTTATDPPVHRMFGGNTQHRVKRYLPTSAGQQYLQTTQASLGQSAGFCYGTKEVDSIVQWTQPTQPMGPALQTDVTYTYKIPDLASWTRRPDIQNQFNDIRTTIAGISRTRQTARLELTNKGWEVPAN